MKVSVKDFQIVKSASLEFVPGLTAILGESNNGKSALFRAIKSCIYNEPGTTNVRVGCKNYMVGIEHKGHKVILQKGENSLYLIDGKQYNKIGRTQVPEVAEALGISALNINDNTEKINFWDQMEKPFLLDRNSSDLFRFIVDSGEDDNLNTTLRSMVTDKNSLNTEKNLKEGSINTLKEQIKNMDELLAGSEDKIKLCENIISFGPMTSKLVTTKTTITNINNTTNTIRETTNNITNRTEIKRELESKLNTISYNISKKAQITEAVTKYTNTSNTLDKLTTQTKDKVDFKAVTAMLEKNITLKTKLADIIAKVSQTQQIINNTKVNRIELSVNQDKINKLSTLQSVTERIQRLQHSVSNIVDEIHKLQQDIKPTLEEYNAIKICPYCGNKLHDGKEVNQT